MGACLFACGLMFGPFESRGTEELLGVGVFFGLIFLTMLLLTGYTLHLFRSRMPTREKVVWLLLFLHASVVSMPVYWWRHVWRKADLGDPSDV